LKTEYAENIRELSEWEGMSDEKYKCYTVEFEI
jgi:hypothetical protein